MHKLKRMENDPAPFEAGLDWSSGRRTNKGELSITQLSVTELLTNSAGLWRMLEVPFLI